ncbi:MAG TPA: S8 family serine peptidase [Chitinophagaceae bacterium]|nr:S8 family serine peptidase [Chitinophagaceae bacterium]
MNRTILLLLLIPVLLLACKKDKVTNSVPEECAQGRTVRDGDIIEGRYIIAYNPSSLSARNKSVEQVAAVSEELLTRNSIRLAALRESFNGEPGGFIADLSANEAARLKNDASVLAVEPDRVVALSICFTVAEPRLVTWNIHRVGYGNGIGKRAWIIDTGIDFGHPDLTVDKAKSRSFITDQPSADDENGHGTHVAGIIGGKNNTIGVLGVASGATLISLRVLDEKGEGTLSSIIQALSYVNSNAAAGDVVNMSLGEEITSLTFNQQVQYTASRGIYVAIAAGNDSKAANLFSPGNANGPNIFTVSAIDSLDNFASFSNFGNDVVDYAAPGVRVLSTFNKSRYAYLSGTSMAAPHVAGLLLLRGRNLTISGTAKNDPDGVADPIAHY